MFRHFDADAWKFCVMAWYSNGFGKWQRHQLGHMQICTSSQTDNHKSIPPLSFVQAGCPSCRPTKSVEALKAIPYCAIICFSVPYILNCFNICMYLILFILDFVIQFLIFQGRVYVWYLLYPPSERSELARYHVMLFPSVCPSFREHSVFRCKYLENGLR